MTEQLLLSDCLARLNRIGIPYYLTGSMASNFWGIPRTTHDLDFVICLDLSAVRAIVDVFKSDFYVDEQSVQAALRPPFQFNVIDTRSALKVDFWVPGQSPFDQEMLRRRLLTDIDGVEAWI